MTQVGERPFASAKLCGLILAGGQARRFGRDKRLATLGDQRLIDLCVARFAPQVHRLVISANDQIPGLEAVTHLRDQEACQGPLLGIGAGLSFAAGEGFDWLITVPADSPFLPHDLARSLLQHDGEARIRFASSPGQRHPIFGAWPTHLAASVWAHIAAGERKIDRVAEALGGYSDVFWPLQAQLGDPFFNINRREDLAAAQRLYRASSASS